MLDLTHNVKQQFHVKNTRKSTPTPTAEARYEFKVNYTMLVQGRNSKKRRKYEKIGRGAWGKQIAGRRGQYLIALPRGLPHGDTMGVMMMIYHHAIVTFTGYSWPFRNCHGFTRQCYRSNMAIHGTAIGFRDPNGHSMLYETWHGIGTNMPYLPCYLTPMRILRPAVV